MKATAYFATILVVAINLTPGVRASDTRQGLAATEGVQISSSGVYRPRPDEMRSGFID